MAHPRQPKTTVTMQVRGGCQTGSWLSDPLEHQGAIGAAKTEVVLDSHIQLGIPRSIGAVVQIALGIGVMLLNYRAVIFCTK